MRSGRPSTRLVFGTSAPSALPATSSPASSPDLIASFMTLSLD